MTMLTVFAKNKTRLLNLFSYGSYEAWGDKVEQLPVCLLDLGPGEAA